MREVEEETGLKIRHPVKHGTFTVFFGAGDEADWIVHVFGASNFTGQLRPSLEGKLRWFRDDRLPENEMWPSDRYWLPEVLFTGRRFEATFWFDEAETTVLRHAVSFD